ncbi:cytochrome c1 isoform X2 [Syngnathoides biaculeatus]|uniref:cytochrome c1 isoform X2 n=1 Tax=Syngnathoides biaculeatus TaxID=300417 RepID=UPI002ADD65E6|nr:cytochrome c1 isoform X2 [Syngnathoides biaculeatus]
MMSYLWILLLFGGLFAERAHTEDDVAPTEFEAVHSTLLPQFEMHPEMDAETAAEDMLPGEPEPTEAGAHQEVMPEANAEDGAEAPAEGEEEGAPQGGDEVAADPELDPVAEEETDAAGEPEPEATLEPEAEQEPEAAAEPQPEAEPEPAAEPAAEPEPEPEAAEEPAAEPGPEAPEEPTTEPQPDTTAAEEAEAEAPESETEPSTQGPADGLEDPESAQDVADVDEDPSASADASHVHEEHGSDDEGAVGANAAAPHDESAHAEMDVDTEIEARVPSDGGFNLEDALAQGDAHDMPAHSGRSNSGGSVAHVSEATGEDADVEESGSGSLAAILCAVAVAVVGAAAGYFTYQKKKLCFKNLHEEQDPEVARKADAGEAQSDPQVLSNLLNSS